MILYGLPWWLSSEEFTCNTVMQGTRIHSLGWGDPLEEGTATCSSVLAWRIPGREEPGGLQSTESQKGQSQTQLTY